MMFTESPCQQPPPRGIYCDQLIDPAGQLVWRRPWQSNLIVSGLSLALAALAKGEGAPLAIWAIGTGDVLWDQGVSLPAPEARRLFTQLQRETGRETIDQINFLSPDDSSAEPPPVAGVTNRLEIRASFTLSSVSDAGNPENLQLREFGLFSGGTAAIANSGRLINHVIHPRIDLQAGFTLQRTLRLTF